MQFTYMLCVYYQTHVTIIAVLYITVTIFTTDIQGGSTNGC